MFPYATRLANSPHFNLFAFLNNRTNQPKTTTTTTATKEEEKHIYLNLLIVMIIY